MSRVDRAVVKALSLTQLRVSVVDICRDIRVLEGSITFSSGDELSHGTKVPLASPSFCYMLQRTGVGYGAGPSNFCFTDFGFADSW
jgi:hypothetical protein